VNEDVPYLPAKAGSGASFFVKKMLRDFYEKF